MLEGRGVGVPTLLPGHTGSGAVVFFEAEPHYIGSGERDSSFGDQPATERYFPDEFAGECAPPEGTGDNAAQLKSLLAVADRTAVGGCELEGHSNLIHRQKCGVGGE